MANSCQQTNKLSPRKFSEKIALLNKKEAEGNAEFEEIIKEVQATTRSQCSSMNCFAGQDDLTCQQQPFYMTTTGSSCGQQFSSPDGSHFSEQQNLPLTYSHSSSSSTCNQNIYTDDYYISSELQQQQQQQQINSSINEQQSLGSVDFQQQPAICFEKHISGVLANSPQQEEQANVPYVDNTAEVIILDSLNYSENEQEDTRFWLDVPDIKICTINDNQQQQLKLNLSQENHRVSPSEDGSLPDITSLQFCCSEDQNNYVDELVNSADSSVVTIRSPDLECTNWPVKALKKDSNLGYSTNVLNVHRSMTPTGNHVPSTYILPKVNNQLSSSDCGLTNERSQDELTLSSQNTNNIIRSYSHNNIDYMTKYNGLSNNSSNVQYINMGQNQQYNLHHSNQQHDPIHQMNQCGLQIYQARLNHQRGSNTSIRPQYGSTSPIDSLSNPNSPQSETQNSPSSSTTEPSEYLPFPVITTTTCNNSSTLTQQCYSNQETYPSSKSINYNEDTSEGAFMKNDLFYTDDNSFLIKDGCGTIDLPVQEQSDTNLDYTVYYQQPDQQQHPDIYNHPLPEVCSSQNLVQETVASTQIGHGHSLSSSHRLHNQVCHEPYSQVSIHELGDINYNNSQT